LQDFQVRKAPLLQADLPARLQGEPQQGQHVQQQGYRSWACCAKHLCGAATDFGLRACLSEQQRGAHAAAGGSGAAEHQGRDIWDAWQGLAIATCCHHRCGWRSYVGKHIWKSWGLTALDFEIACAITGWALCGHDAPQGCTGLSGADDDQSAGRCSDDDEGCEQPQSKQQDEQPDSTDHTPVEPDIAVWPYLSRTQRMALGLKCKTMIDWGRAAYAAQQLGLQRRLGLTAKQGSVGDSGTDGAGVVQFVRYIRPDVSGENRLLVVRPAAASPVDGSPAAAV
jgi:tRNA:m4X modification enzyme